MAASADRPHQRRTRRLARLFAHRDHSLCSIYAPCRKADLARSWQQFVRLADNPATRDATIRAELLRMAERREPC